MAADHQISSYLRILEGDGDIEEKRNAFDVLRLHFTTPISNRSLEYAQELQRVFALRFPPWDAPPLELKSRQLLADQIRGVVFGCALGDAIGLSTEFLSIEQVQRYYPDTHVFRPSANVLPDLHRVNFPHGDWTDDTDQLILILQTLLECGGSFDGSTFAHKLKDWFREGFPSLGDSGGAGMGRTTSMVVHHPSFLDHPRQAALDVWERSGRVVAPNGAAMRTAITGVPFFWNPETVDETTRAFCTATHADPRCVATCLVVAGLVRRMLDRTSKLDHQAPSIPATAAWVEEAISLAVEHAISATPELSSEHATELRSYASNQSLADLQLANRRSIGYTFKVMGAGLWALRAVARNDASPAQVFEQIARAAGDADTNGAVAGALVGCLVGLHALPYVADLPYGGWLEAWVQKVLFMMKLPIEQRASY